MSNIIDYLKWRGDLTFDCSPFGAVDNLVLSVLSYVRFCDILSPEISDEITIKEACCAFLELEEQEQLCRVRTKNDILLVKELVNSKRFGELSISAYKETRDKEMETQFVALFVKLNKKEGFVSFSGTDATVAGWKEGFNMTVQDIVPAQQSAFEYLSYICKSFGGKLRVGGHSKGGNLAIFSSSSLPPHARRKIINIYNNDGPGFWSKFIEKAGYEEVLSKIETFIPESSIVGVLFEHSGKFTVIGSNALGPMQHDPYHWEVYADNFVIKHETSKNSKLAERTARAWIEGLSVEERREFINAIYELLKTNDIDSVHDVIHPKKVFTIVRSLKNENKETKKMMFGTLREMITLANEVRQTAINS